MSNVKTRIILRNDTLANWEAENSLSLLNGEMAIAVLQNGLAEIRIGNGGKWDTARKIQVDAAQISGIIDTIRGNTKKYQVVAVDGQSNSWKLQEAPLSAADNEWADVTGSTWSIDLDGLSNTISTTYATKQELSDAIDALSIGDYALSADVDSLVAKVSADTLSDANDYTNDAIEAISDTISTDYATKEERTQGDADTLSSAKEYTDEQIAALSIGDYATKAEVNQVSIDLSTDYTGKIDAVADTLNTVSTDYLKATDFNTISTTIGLDRANAANPVVTSSDIADITGAMHFRGVVTKQEGETDQQALARVITDPRAGDVALVGTAEYVYGGDPAEWKQFGDEGVYATVAYVDTQDGITYTSAVTSAMSYADAGDASTYASALSDAKDYTDGEIEGLSNIISTVYATKTEVNDVSVALSTDYTAKIEAISGNYATKTYVDDQDAATYESAVTSANAYTDDQISTLSDAFDTKLESYATKTEVNNVSVALSNDYVGKIGDLSDEIYGALEDYALSADVTSLVNATSAETLVSANAYTDEQIAALSIDNYIKHGEVVQSDLSGFFILDCGNSVLREGEPTSEG